MRATERRSPWEPAPTILHDLTGRDSSGLPAVAAVHPGVLPATAYQRLADELAVDHDMYVLDLTGVPEYRQATMASGGTDVDGVTVEGVAGRFATALGKRAADAPALVLVGWSLGGTLAFELTRQIDAPGSGLDQPNEVLLLDAMAPRERLPEDTAKVAPALLSWFAMYLGAKRGSRLSLPEERFESGTVEDGLAIIRAAAAEADVLPEDTPLVGLRKLYDTYVDGLVGYIKLTALYQSKATSKPLTLIKAEGSLRPNSPDLGWSVLADGGLSVRTSPGDHYTMLADPRAVAAIAGFVREKTDGLLATEREEVAKA